MAALSLTEKGLIGQFTGLWPSPRTVQRWVERNWADKIQGKISIRFCGKGYFSFDFESKEDKDLIFRNRPYFMDSRGLYLNKWTLDFDPKLDVPSDVSVWVRLPHLPLHCWGDESVRAIGNAMGKYIDHSEPKDNMQACTRICVEVDLGKGLPEAIKLKVDEWSHIQQLDYEQITFRCKVCHEYGHFTNRCRKLVYAESGDQEGQWESIKMKKSTAPPKPSQESVPLAPSTSRPSSSSPPSFVHPSPDPSIPSSSNPFLVLSSLDPSSMDPPQSPLNLFEPSDRPPFLITSSQVSLEPSFPRHTRSSTKEHGTANDIHKKPGLGRKSAKQHRDENAQKDIAMGTQTPIESFIQGHQEKETNHKEQER